MKPEAFFNPEKWTSALTKHKLFISWGF